MPVSAENEWRYWDTKATELRRNQLTTVQTAATKWSAVLTALLGVFGTVAFAGGLSTIDKLPDSYALFARVLTTAAAVAAVVAIGLLNRAAGGLRLVTHEGLGAKTAQEIFTTGAKSTLKWMKWGKRFAVATAALVLIGSGIVLWAGEEAESDPSPPTLVAVVGGQLVCGELGIDGTSLTIDGQPADGATGILVVSGCPE